MHGLIENEQINEYVRSGALEAFLVLENEGQVSRESVLEYFTSLFHGRLQRVPSYAWNSLVCAVADLPAPELIDDIRQAYDEGLVDTMVAGLDGLERDLKSPPRRDRQPLITDAIDEMEWWASFHPDDSQPTKLPKLKTPVPPPRDSDFAPDDIAPDDIAPLPFVREPKIGRNEACPCGSGKKYKKCCGKYERWNSCAPCWPITRTHNFKRFIFGARGAYSRHKAPGGLAKGHVRTQSHPGRNLLADHRGQRGILRDAGA